MLCQSEWACIYQTVNIVVFFTKKLMTIQKGRVLVEMYRVVPQTKRVKTKIGNTLKPHVYDKIITKTSSEIRAFCIGDHTPVNKCCIIILIFEGRQ